MFKIITGRCRTSCIDFVCFVLSILIFAMLIACFLNELRLLLLLIWFSPITFAVIYYCLINLVRFKLAFFLSFKYPRQFYRVSSALLHSVRIRREWLDERRIAKYLLASTFRRANQLARHYPFNTRASWAHQSKLSDSLKIRSGIFKLSDMRGFRDLRLISPISFVLQPGQNILFNTAAIGRLKPSIPVYYTQKVRPSPRPEIKQVTYFYMRRLFYDYINVVTHNRSVNSEIPSRFPGLVGFSRRYEPPSHLRSLVTTTFSVFQRWRLWFIYEGLHICLVIFFKMKLCFSKTFYSIVYQILSWPNSPIYSPKRRRIFRLFAYLAIVLWITKRIMIRFVMFLISFTTQSYVNKLVKRIGVYKIREKFWGPLGRLIFRIPNGPRFFRYFRGIRYLEALSDRDTKAIYLMDGFHSGKRSYHYRSFHYPWDYFSRPRFVNDPASGSAFEFLTLPGNIFSISFLRNLVGPTVSVYFDQTPIKKYLIQLLMFKFRNSRPSEDFLEILNSTYRLQRYIKMLLLVLRLSKKFFRQRPEGSTTAGSHSLRDQRRIYSSAYFWWEVVPSFGYQNLFSGSLGSGLVAAWINKYRASIYSPRIFYYFTSPYLGLGSTLWFLSRFRLLTLTGSEQFGRTLFSFCFSRYVRRRELYFYLNHYRQGSPRRANHRRSKKSKKMAGIRLVMNPQSGRSLLHSLPYTKLRVMQLPEYTNFRDGPAPDKYGNPRKQKRRSKKVGVKN